MKTRSRSIPTTNQTPMPDTLPATLSYQKLIQQIAEQLGAVYFPLNRQADSPLNMVEPESAYAPLLKEVVSRIYAENRSRHLHSPVSLFPCLDAVGKIRGELSRSQADVEQIALVDRIGEILVTTLPAPQTNR